MSTLPPEYGGPGRDLHVVDNHVLTRVHEQEEWMAQHGGDLHGYVKHYGSGMDPVHHGDGGELIYEADYQALSRLRRAAEGLV